MASNTDDILEEADHCFELAEEAEAENRRLFIEDIRFGRLGEQWPEALRKEREAEDRPCLTLNHMPAFVRQVVNDCRQNKPAIKVAPVDSGGDLATAKVFDGIIRNIEQESVADIAYDTAVEYAASGGFGYFRIHVDYAHDDTFDQDILIERIANPLSVYGDPASTAADSSDWNKAFLIEAMPTQAFEEQYPDAEPVDWKDESYANVKPHWRDGDDVIVAEYWNRKEVTANLLQLSNGEIIKEDVYVKSRELFDALGVQVTNSRPTRSYKVCQYIMTGAEVLETNEWASKYIPIVPVYGEELNIEGKRYFRSLIRDAKDAQRMHNYWETVSTELAALQPRVPYIGEEGSFDVDKRWKTSNKKSHPYLEYAKGRTPPQRQPLDSGPAISAIAESKRSVDSMKAIMGLYNASLGERSNETSGVAINSRKVEGEVSTFHFPDNLARAIGHGGRILLDLIPQVYSPGRIVRTLGYDGTAKPIQVGDPSQRPPQPTGAAALAPMGAAPPGGMPGPGGAAQPAQPGEEQPQDATPQIYYLNVGKYDLSVKAGPSYTTRRQEAAAEMTELIRAFPDAAPIIGDILVKNLDWPGADEIAERLKRMLPPQAGGGPDPETQKMIQEGGAKIQELEQKTTQQEQQLQLAKAKEQIANAQHQIELQMKDLEIQKLQAMEQVNSVVHSHEQQVAGENQARQAEQFEAQNQAHQQEASSQQNNQIGSAIAEAAKGLAEAIRNMPPLQVVMPPMKRTPVRDPKTQMIMHTVDEPMN